MLECFPERASVRDLLVVPDEGQEFTSAISYLCSLEGDEGFQIGTGSPRRVDQLKHQLQEQLDGSRVERFNFDPIRGNIGTRLSKLLDGECQGLVMAEAALARLSVRDCPELAKVHVLGFCPETEMIPAPGQAALGVAARSDDAESREIIQTINNLDVQFAVDAERSLLSAIGGGCFVPVGAWCRKQEDDQFELIACLAEENDGGEIELSRGMATAENDESAPDLGCRVAKMMGLSS